jgi:hypothetical protein
MGGRGLVCKAPEGFADETVQWTVSKAERRSVSDGRRPLHKRSPNGTCNEHRPHWLGNASHHRLQSLVQGTCFGMPLDMVLPSKSSVPVFSSNTSFWPCSSSRPVTSLTLPVRVMML